MKNDDSSEILETRLIDIACKWGIRRNNFPAVKIIQKFLKTYRDEQLSLREQIDRYIIFSEAQNIV